jgi:hypothetical protein
MVEQRHKEVQGSKITALPDQEAKRLLLERSCKNCYVLIALLKTVTTVGKNGAILFEDSETKVMFLETLYPLLRERRCSLDIHFEGATPTIKFPKEGYCDNWGKRDDEEPDEI